MHKLCGLKWRRQSLTSASDKSRATRVFRAGKHRRRGSEALVPRLVDLNVYGGSCTPKRDNVCKLFALGYDLCITKYHVQCKKISDWLDLPLIWIYMAVCEAALRGVTSGVTQAMLPRALAAGGSGNASIRVSTDGKAGYISTTGTLPTPTSSPKSLVSPFFPLEAPFCAAVGQRTRRRRPKVISSSLRNINVKLV